VLTHAIASAGPSGAAYGDAFRWVLGAGLLMAVPAIFLARAESRPAGGPPSDEEASHLPPGRPTASSPARAPLRGR
jgi:hypothetical protein